MSLESPIVSIPSMIRKTAAAAAATATATTTTTVVTTAAAAAAATAMMTMKFFLDRPSRTYQEGSVAREYDAWTSDGILEYYWGEHIHLGYYNDKEREEGYRKKNFIQAKYDFIDQMMSFGSIDPKQYQQGPDDIKVLDVGCGFGGTSRYLAKALGSKAHVTGITLSPNQVQRGTQLAQQQNVSNVQFLLMDALRMDFANHTFDIVWACESGEHMPDKQAYISEMMRVLKPGGKFVMATWCQREDGIVPFTAKDRRDLRYLYEEWTHPYFISIDAYRKLMEQEIHGLDLNSIQTANWVKETIPSWRHSIWVGIQDPRGFIWKPNKYVKCVRDAYCLERMHRAFRRGLMEYGMFAAIKETET
jgi:MPBQ/MSBQ methyltransferase